MERSYTKATKWCREPNYERMVSWRRWSQKTGPSSEMCLIALLGGQEIQWKGKENTHNLAPRSSCGPGGKNKQQQEGTEAQKMLRDGDLGNILVKNMGFGVRQPWLKGRLRDMLVWFGKSVSSYVKWRWSWYIPHSRHWDSTIMYIKCLIQSLAHNKSLTNGSYYDYHSLFMLHTSSKIPLLGLFHWPRKSFTLSPPIQILPML